MAKKQKLATEPAGEIVVNGEPAKEKRESIWKDVFAGIVSNKASLVSGIFILLLIVIALVTKFVPSVLPYDPNAQNLSESLLGPSAQHWFGTDIQGRDIFCRVLVGTQITLTVGLAAVAISLTVGVLLGLSLIHIFLMGLPSSFTSFEAVTWAPWASAATASSWPSPSTATRFGASVFFVVSVEASFVSSCWMAVTSCASCCCCVCWAASVWLSVTRRQVR